MINQEEIQVYVFGDRNTTIDELPEKAIKSLDKIISLGANIHISDARGTDKLVQKYLKGKNIKM